MPDFNSTSASESGYIPVGGTGSQSETGSDMGTSTGETMPDAPIATDGCTPASSFSSLIEFGNPDCSTVPQDYDLYQSIITDQSEDTGYDNYVGEPKWQINYHTLQMPVADTNSTQASFAVVAQPTAKMTLQWAVSKYGDFPNMPIAETGDPNQILLDSIITGQSVDLMADQVTPIYTIMGVYTYAFVDYTGINMYLGVQPYVGMTVTSTAIPDSNFITGLASV